MTLWSWRGIAALPVGPDRRSSMSESSSTSPLTAAAVEEVFAACLYREEEDGPYQVTVSGAHGAATFSRIRLDNERRRIRAMLEELPSPFRRSAGGGWSFLNLGVDRRGHRWTDLDVEMDRLMMLGLGTNLLRFTLDRSFWASLPGRAPYVIFEDALA